MIPFSKTDSKMDAGELRCVLDIPPDFQRGLMAGKPPTIELNVDARRMSQAFNRYVHVQQIVLQQVEEFQKNGKVV